MREKGVLWLRRRRIMKTLSFLVVLVLSFLMPVAVYAEKGHDVQANIVVATIDGNVWHYGDPKMNITVAENTPVSVSFSLFYEKKEMKQFNQEREALNLFYQLPEGVYFYNSSSDVVAEINGSMTTIGQVFVENQKLKITITQDNTRRMMENDNIIILAHMLLGFEPGTHDLGSITTVTATNKIAGKAKWNNYGLKIYKIDMENTANILEGAEFLVEQAVFQKESHSLGSFEPCSGIFEENETFIKQNNLIISRANKEISLVGDVEPGNIYRITEQKAPIGYLPDDTAYLYAFYHYTDDRQQGVLNKVKELNQQYRQLYDEKNVPAKTRFGSESGILPAVGNLYIGNKKTPKLIVIKRDQESSDPIPGVRFRLMIPENESIYDIASYKKLHSSWQYDAEKKQIYWDAVTDSEGKIEFPREAIPYAGEHNYRLIETVPEGYAGYEREREYQFHLNSDGSAVQAGEESLSVTVSAEQNMIELTVYNRKAGQLRIKKVNAEGEALEGAEFILYGPKEAAQDLNDTYKKDGVTAYKVADVKTDAQGIAQVQDLPYGQYWLKETKAPAGYALPAGDYPIEISKEKLEQGYVMITVINRIHIQMPNMGGAGTGGYLFAGTFLVVIGFMILFPRKRKKNHRRSGIGKKNEKEKKWNPDRFSGR